MRQEDLDQISNWMANPENIKKLEPIEAAQVNLYMIQYQEKIAPIIMRAMARDDKILFQIVGGVGG